MSAPQPHDICPRCHIAFGMYVAEDDPVAQCAYCLAWLHTDCMERHWCAEQATEDAAKLRAWVSACKAGAP